MGYINKSTINSSLYDANTDGTINSGDMLSILKEINGTFTNNKKISGTFQINSSDPKNFLSIKNSSNLAVSLGVGGVNAHLISAESIICGTSTSSDFSGVAINGSTGSVKAKSFNNISLESMKKNITKFEDALEIIKNSDIYEYNFKDEEDTEKKHIGFIIEDISEGKYKTSEKVLSSNKKAIESYSMVSIEWRALQQILERLEILERK